MLKFPPGELIPRLQKHAFFLNFYELVLIVDSYLLLLISVPCLASVPPPPVWIGALEVGWKAESRTRAGVSS